MEHRLRRADGRFRRVLAHGEPLLDATGRLRGYVGSSVDITDLTPLNGKKGQSFETREAALQQLARRIAAARAEERADLARELHDGLDQTLTAIKFELRRATTVFKKDGLRPQAVDRLQSLIGLADIGIATVKRLATNFRSVSIDHRGLLPAIRWEATAYRARTGVRCDVHAASESTALTLEQQTIVFRVLQEALTNVARHADASAVSIDLAERRGVFELQVRDNGRGITTAQKSHPRSIGLLGMRERVALAGGVLEIRGRRGKGTTVVVRVKAGRRFARTAETKGTRG
jgi:two-component system sensor histidine kinase UhpB